MSEDPKSTEPGSEEVPAKKPRKTAAPKARKAAKTATKAPKDTTGIPDVPQTPSAESLREPEPLDVPKPLTRQEEPVEESGKSGWPEVETIQGPGNQPSGSGKRKRRRKKKGGQAQQQGGAVISLESSATAPRGNTAQPPAAARSQEQAPVETIVVPTRAPQASQGTRVQLDPEDLAKKAWKIFQSEVAEEGLALIGEQDARELSRKSFRLAEVFLEEQARRTR